MISIKETTKLLGKQSCVETASITLRSKYNDFEKYGQFM